MTNSLSKFIIAMVPTILEINEQPRWVLHILWFHCSARIKTNGPVEDSGRQRVTLTRRPWPQNYPKCSIIEVFSRCRTRVTRSSLANSIEFRFIHEYKKLYSRGYCFPPALPMIFLCCARERLVESFEPIYKHK